MPPLLLKLVFDRLDSPAVPFLVRPISRAIAQKALKTFIRPQIETHLDFLEGELKSRPPFDVMS
jgi:glutathione S-transferase